ncbi:hypothetical protein [Calderihabitans maritimus]|uniref:Uncharacterized protein n=1 Tax=Calderihabitans maritimus TaxID=1246530 RepID=A0A1Z5HS56_9FIRM|nr:hypothetical protein [Calderihabitans maritimus]GAW92155.1 hypothetical protein KKC1_13140 [Calderihabitans maritimus]
MEQITLILIVVAVIYLLFLGGGIYFWLTKPRETKPHLAARMDETEAKILAEVEKEAEEAEKRAHQHKTS